MDLEAKDSQFLLFAESLPHMAWMAHPDGNIFWYNRRWYEYTGTTFEQMQGWGWQSVHDPRALPDVLARWKAALASGEPFDRVLSIKGSDGVFRPFLTRVIPVTDDSDRVIRWIGTNTDITFERLNEEVLREAKSRLESTLAASEIGTWEYDVVNNAVRADRNLAKMFGVNSDEATGIESYFRAIHVEDRARVQSAVNTALTVGSEYETEYRLQSQDGVTRWVVARGRVERNGSGQAIRLPGVVVDVTALHETQSRALSLKADVETAHAKFRAFFEQGAIFAAIADVHGVVLEANRQSWEGCGYTREQVVGRKFWEGPWWNSSPNLAKQIEAGAKQAAEGKTYRSEIPYHIADGTRRLLDLSIIPIKDDSGRVIFLAPTGTDISDRVRAEWERGELAARLLEKSRLLDSVLSSISDFVYIFDTNGRFTFVNAPLLNLWGLTLEEAQGKNFFDLKYPEELATKLQDQIRQVIVTRQKLVDVTPYTSPSGKSGFYQYIFSPVEDGTGNVVAVAGSTRDISDLLQAENSSRDSEERYRTLFNSMDQGFCVIEVLFDDAGNPIDYVFLEINPAFEKHTGLGNAVGKRVRELIPNHDQHWFDLYGKVVKTGEEVHVLDHASALGRWFDVFAFRQGDAGSHKVAVFFSDVTDRRRVEDALKTADRRKDEFLAVVSHELRTPLTAMLGWIKLLRSGALTEEKGKYGLEVIERNVKVQAHLIEDLLDISRIITGKLHLEVQSLNLKTVIEAAIESVRPALEAKRLELNSRLEWVGISGDQNRLQQIVWNLLTNAIKFTPNGGRIDIELRRVNGQAQVVVRDTGRGIDSDFLPLIFNRFQQGNVGITRNFAGLGLGLSIVRHLVELHSGKISAHSDGEGTGATFTVEFPLPASARAVSDIPDSPVSASNPLKGLTILVVDDEADTRDIMELVLQMNGAQVITARDVLEAIEHFTHLVPDVIVSDISMPDEDGCSLMRRVRSSRAGGNTPALALTAFAREEDRKRILESGFNAFASKPIEPAQLISKVIEIAGRSITPPSLPSRSGRFTIPN